MRYRSEQTICAISTPPGVGGIAVIRVSGLKALEITTKIAPALSKKKIRSHTVHFVKLQDLKNEIIDEVIVTFFEKGKSFTGEEVVEISCHGSEYISEKILDMLIDSGAALAEKGEFTFRAFMNNRLDLVQAESVLSLIQSQNQTSPKRRPEAALKQRVQKLDFGFELMTAQIPPEQDPSGYS